ncbi:MAG TPA: M28 family peptidase [Anaerolineales bacterium]|nr:M28 family peptidase [Anaerolineales bacterium]
MPARARLRRGLLWLAVGLIFAALGQPVSGQAANPGLPTPESASLVPSPAKSAPRQLFTHILNPAAQPAGADAEWHQYSPLPGPSPLVLEMMAQVEEALVSAYTGDLSGEWPVDIGGSPFTILTRHSFSGEPIQKAAAYLSQYYQGLGLQTAFQEFPLGPVTLNNIIAQQDGSLFPERLYLVTSHYDDAPSGPRAPGADDNASGTVGVMLAASILSQYEFGCSLRFVNFAGEEQGLVGSRYSAKSSDCRGEAIQAVLNLDMIGWNTAGSPPGMELHANQSIPGSLDIALLFADVVETYGLDLETEIDPSGIGSSDHASYWTYQLPAILAIEDLQDFNPNYHAKSDRLSALKDLPYFTAMIKASLGTMAHMSCLIEEQWGSLAGVVFNVQTGEPVSGASLKITNPDWGYSFDLSSEEHGGFQHALLPGEHTLQVRAPGYEPALMSGILILPGEQTIQDIYLQPSGETLVHLPLIGGATPEPGETCP